MGSKNCIPGKSGGSQASWAKGLHLGKALALSSTGTVHSDQFNANNLDNIGLFVSFVGSMTGTITVECSIDLTNWTALTFSTALSQPAGSNLNYLINLNQLPFPYLRVSYTNASGSGTLDVWLSAKDLN